MSRSIVTALQGSFARSFSLILQFIEVCPEDIWQQKFGGWPVWQQVYHTLASIDFFVLGLDEEHSKGLFAPEAGNVGNFENTPEKGPSKAAMQEFAAVIKAKADAYIDGLLDADLSGKNRGFSARINMDMSHASTLSILSGHILYHLGSCDAALRERGLKGVF